MITKAFDNNGNELFLVSERGFLRVYTSNRTLYSGPVLLKTECDNGIDPCTETEKGKCQDCSCNGTDPITRPIYNLYMKDYKREGGDYDMEEVKIAINAADRLPPGVCSTQKAFLICQDAIIICEWQLSEWVIKFILDIPYVQIEY